MVYFTPPALITSLSFVNFTAPVPYKTFKLAKGFSSTITKSANLPIWIEPILSSQPRASAPFNVAARITSKGWKPASRNNSNSLIYANPYN